MTAEHPPTQEGTMLRRWILWTSYFGFFTSGVFFMAGSVHLLFFYFVMVGNLGLLALAGSLWFPPGLLLFLGFTLLSSALGIAGGTDTFALLLKSLVGLWLSAIYACAFLRFMRFDAVDCFRRYAQAAYYFALSGLASYSVFVVIYGRETRLHSFAIEPGEYCIVTLPAIYFWADRWQRGKGGGGKLLFMLLALLLSRSSVGFMGVLIGLFLFCWRYRFGWLLAPVLMVALGGVIFGASSDFQMRLTDSISGFTQMDGADLNGSSLSQVSGAYVAWRALMDHPIWGGGLGSISLANRRYVDGLSGISQLPDEMRYVAGGDGGSLLYRLAGETGLAGLGMAFSFLWYCYPRDKNAERQQTALAILVYCFARLLRGGSYLAPEELFLFTAYAVNGSRLLRQLRRQMGPRRIQAAQPEEAAC